MLAIDLSFQTLKGIKYSVSRNCRCDYYRFLQSFETETPLKAKTKISLYWTLSELGYFSKEKNSQGLQIQRRTMKQRYKDTQKNNDTTFAMTEVPRLYHSGSPIHNLPKDQDVSEQNFWGMVIFGLEEYLCCGHIWSRGIFEDIMPSH